MPRCLTSIFSSIKPSKECTKMLIAATEEEIIPLLPSLTAVFIPENMQLTTDCLTKGMETIVGAAIIINSSECNIVSRGITSNIAQPFQLYQPLSFADDDVKPNTISSVQALHRQQSVIDARESIKNDRATILREPDTGMTIATIFTVAGTMIVIFIKNCCYSTHRPTRWFPEWEGTITSTMEHNQLMLAVLHKLEEISKLIKESTEKPEAVPM